MNQRKIPIGFCNKFVKAHELSRLLTLLLRWKVDKLYSEWSRLCNVK